MLTALKQQLEVPLDEALAMAQGHHQAGNYVLAERTYRDILRAVPNHFPTTQFLGGILYQAGSYEEARHFFELAVEAAEDDVNCLNNFGGVLLQMKEYDEALKYFDQALAINSDNVDVLNNKAYGLWLKKQYAEAEKCSRKVLKIDHQNIIALNGLAMTLARLFRYEEALDAWELATKYDSENPMLWSNWGNALREMGRLLRAREKCEKAVSLDGKNPDALNNLANVLRDLGELEKAIELYNRATDEMPGYAEAHNNKAMAYHDNNQFEASIISANYAIALKPEFAEAHTILCTAYSSNGDYEKAHSAAQRAVHFSTPDQADPYIALSNVLARLDRFDESLAALAEALNREPESARTYLKLSEVYESLNNPDEAHNVIDRALELSPDMPRLYARKGMLYHMEADTENALRYIDKAIEMAPDWVIPYQQKAEVLISNNDETAAEEMIEKAKGISKNLPGPHIMLATFKKYESETDPAFVELKSFEDKIKTFGKDIEVNYYFALADAYESMKKYHESFEYLKKASDLKLSISPATELEQGLVQKLEARRIVYNSTFVKQYSDKIGYKTDLPVFICGMPRSGTTLTEQIISSHPDVFGAGELTYIGDIASYLSNRSEMTPELLTELGKTYIEKLRARDRDGTAKRITDKMPGNCMNLGLIAMSLPGAKIIHCRRNAIDTCLSCFQQNFSTGHYWSYNLEETAEFYKQYEAMMAHWRQVLPGRFIEIEYEDTVNDLEAQARRLIDYIGLEWNDACLEPHKKKRSVLTASRSQVTKPVYKTSVEKWRRYEKELEPLITKLGA